MHCFAPGVSTQMIWWSRIIVMPVSIGSTGWAGVNPTLYTTYHFPYACLGAGPDQGPNSRRSVSWTCSVNEA